MRTTLVARMQLVSAQLQIENTIRGVIEELRPQDWRGSPQPVRGARCRITRDRRYAGIGSCDRGAAIEALLRVREGMPIERKAQDRALATLSRRDQVTRRLMTIPGLGPVTALAFKATIDDVERFATSKALGAHLGLTPRVYQSGEIDRSGHISKSGDK